MRKIAILSITLIFLYCKKSSESDLKLMEKCIDEIIISNPLIEACYIVNPSINSSNLKAAEKESKNGFQSGVSLLPTIWNKIKDSDSKFYKEINNLSSCESSKHIFSFSEPINEHILVKLEIKYNAIQSKNISNTEENENNLWELYLFKINDDNSVKVIDHFTTYKN